MIRLTKPVLAVAALACGCAARATSDPAAAAGVARRDYLPLRRGSAWTYLVTDETGRRGVGRVRVEGFDFARGARPAAIVRWDLPDETIISWDRLTPAGVVCDEEEVRDHSDRVISDDLYDPPVTVVDERPGRLAAGAEWSETVADTFPNDRWRPKTKELQVRWHIESVDDRVTVPAGTFTCLRVRRAPRHRPPTTAWFADKVGLIKEIGAGRAGNETLVLVRAGG
jgi:hypothetical protein